MDDRQQERERLPRPRLAPARHIAAREQQRHARGLHARGRPEPEPAAVPRRQVRNQPRRQPQRLERPAGRKDRVAGHCHGALKDASAGGGCGSGGGRAVAEHDGNLLRRPPHGRPTRPRSSEAALRGLGGLARLLRRRSSRGRVWHRRWREHRCRSVPSAAAATRRRPCTRRGLRRWRMSTLPSVGYRHKNVERGLPHAHVIVGHVDWQHP